MKNRKVIFKLIIYILVTGILAVTMYYHGKADSTIQIFNDAEIQQCIWGEWRINEMYFGGVGWQQVL